MQDFKLCTNIFSHVTSSSNANTIENEVVSKPSDSDAELLYTPDKILANHKLATSYLLPPLAPETILPDPPFIATAEHMSSSKSSPSTTKASEISTEPSDFNLDGEDPTTSTVLLIFLTCLKANSLRFLLVVLM